jgi:hypothetical protein
LGEFWGIDVGFLLGFYGALSKMQKKREKREKREKKKEHFVIPMCALLSAIKDKKTHFVFCVFLGQQLKD